MSYRVVLWTTGHVARFAGRAVVDHPNMELVGAYAWSPEKAGRDVGELIGIEPLGITVHDHIVIGKAGHASMKALRLI